MAKTSKKKKAKEQAKKAKAKELASSSKADDQEASSEDQPESSAVSCPDQLALTVACIIKYGNPLHRLMKLVKGHKRRRDKGESTDATENGQRYVSLANIVLSLENGHLFFDLPYVAREYLQPIYNDMIEQIKGDLGLKSEAGSGVSLQEKSLFTMLSFVDNRFIAVFVGKLTKQSEEASENKTYLLSFEPLAKKYPINVFMSAMKQLFTSDHIASFKKYVKVCVYHEKFESTVSSLLKTHQELITFCSFHMLTKAIDRLGTFVYTEYLTQNDHLLLNNIVTAFKASYYFKQLRRKFFSTLCKMSRLPEHEESKFTAKERLFETIDFTLRYFPFIEQFALEVFEERETFAATFPSYTEAVLGGQKRLQALKAHFDLVYQLYALVYNQQNVEKSSEQAKKKTIPTVSSFLSQFSQLMDKLAANTEWGSAFVCIINALSPISDKDFALGKWFKDVPFPKLPSEVKKQIEKQQKILYYSNLLDTFICSPPMAYSLQHMSTIEAETYSVKTSLSFFNSFSLAVLENVENKELSGYCNLMGVISFNKQWLNILWNPVEYIEEVNEEQVKEEEEEEEGQKEGLTMNIEDMLNQLESVLNLRE